MPSSSDATNDAHDVDSARDRDHTPRRLRKRERLEQIAAALHHTEPLLPAGPVPVHSRDGVHCRVTEYSGECRRIRVVTAMCRKCHERCRRHAAGWQREAIGVAARRCGGRPSEDFVRKLGTSVAPHEKAGREGARRVWRSSPKGLCGDRRVALYSTYGFNGAIATSWPCNAITMSDGDA